MKKLLPILVLVFFVSCGKSGGSKGCEDMACEVSEYSLSTTADGPIPPEVLAFTTNLVLVNFDTSDTTKVQDAADLVRRVIMSQEFKDEIINFTYNGERKFADNNGLTNLQIYDRIVIAAEKTSPAKNFALDVEIELYFENSTTIGYTYPTSRRIWMNTKYFDTYTPYQVAGNLTHEWLHKLGFTHDAAATSSRPYTVPYAVGYLVRELAQELY